MIIRTKNVALKMAISCSVMAAIFLSNGFSAYAEDINNVQATDFQQVQDENQANKDVLIDEPVKYYYDIASVQKHAGFDFKLPSIMESSKWEGGINQYQLLNISDTSKAVMLNYDYNPEKAKVDRHQGGMRLMIFKDDPYKAIQQINESSFNNPFGTVPQYDFKENEKTCGNIKGKEIFVDRIDPNSDGSASVAKSKYFMWQDGSVYYAINYDYKSMYTQDINNMQNLVMMAYCICMDENELSKVVNSFKDVNSISEIDYNVSKADDSKAADDPYYYFAPEINHIYYKDDLIKADELLKFKAKVPSTFTNKNVQIQKSSIECTQDKDENDRKYTLNLYYKNGIEEIAYNQNMYDNYVYDKCEKYSKMKEQGYTVTDEYEHEGISTVESYNVNGIKVYKYVISFAADNNYIYYLWKDNDVYNTLEIKYTSGYEDDIAKDFITAKSVE